MNENIKLLFLTNCVIAVVTVGICLEVINTSTYLQNSFFAILLYFILFETIDILLKLCQYACNINITMARKSEFEFNKNTLIFSINLTICITVIIIKHQLVYKYIQTFDALTCTSCFLISWILYRIIDLNEQRKKHICDITLMQSLECGTFMAYNYYHGYLKIILPSTGSHNKGLVERIENIEDIHNIQIAVHKMFILIPSSSYIPPDLKESFPEWIESSVHLEGEVRDRAGVKKRLYHNTVYKIYPNGKKTNFTPLYVVIEGATPLLTFYEVLKHAYQETNVYKKYKKYIIQQFYEKLKELIDTHLECTGLCELIYYDDYDNNGMKINIAKIILDRLSKIKETNSVNEIFS